MRELLQVTEKLMNELRACGSPASIPANPPVLIVEDNPHDMELMKVGLHEKGFAIYAASDGLSAVRLVAQKPNLFIILFLDLNLPGMDGIEVFRTVKEISPKTHIIIVTGTDRDAELPRDGYYGLVRKPITEKVVDEIVSHARSVAVP